MALSNVWPSNGSGSGLTGTAVTHSPATGRPCEASVTVPEIPPSSASDASIPAVLVATLTVTWVAVDWVGWLLYHRGARFVLPKKKPNGPATEPTNPQNGAPT